MENKQKERLSEFFDGIKIRSSQWMVWGAGRGGGWARLVYRLAKQTRKGARFLSQGVPVREGLKFDVLIEKGLRGKEVPKPNRGRVSARIWRLTAVLERSLAEGRTRREEGGGLPMPQKCKNTTRGLRKAKKKKT